VSLIVCCVTVSDIAGHQRLHSAHRRQLDVPRYRRTKLGCSLSLDQLSGIHFQMSLEKTLKTLSGYHWKCRFSDNISVFSTLEVFTTMHYKNRHFTYVLLQCKLPHSMQLHWTLIIMLTVGAKHSNDLSVILNLTYWMLLYSKMYVQSPVLTCSSSRPNIVMLYLLCLGYDKVCVP